MKRKVLCAEADMNVAIIRALKEPENEADSLGDPMSVTDLSSILEQDFEFSPEELALAISMLSLRGEVAITLKAEHLEEEIYMVVDHIHLNLDYRKKSEKEKEVKT